MKISYGVENLRSLSQTPQIELRPITILVGRNSAGKSTYLRSFALLRQSLEMKSSAPILWYGDYVDFGDFSAAVSNRDQNNEIKFNFRVDDLQSREPDDDFYYYDEFTYHARRRRITYQSVSLSISLGEQLRRTVRRSVRLEVPEDQISAIATFEKDGRECSEFEINGQRMSDLIPGVTVLFRASDLFDKPVLVRQVKKDGKALKRVTATSLVIGSAIAQRLRQHVDKRISEDNLAIEARRILKHARLNQSSLDDLCRRAGNRSFEKLYDRWRGNDVSITLAEIDHLCALNHALTTISRVSSALKDFFRNTTYLGPARARSERYYRSQELEVSEISPDGQNLPMFLASLSTKEQNRFSDWVEKSFGFGVLVERKEGHVSIQLRQHSISVNVADTGYGVSQILPVLAQIWWATQMPRYAVRQTRHGLRPITMEQPELHLHPAHQAKLADVFQSAIERNDSTQTDAVLLIETHSEALINRLGELVECGSIDPKDVQVVIFSASGGEQDLKTEISTSTFDGDGVLRDWPYGFFNY